ncbi:diphosphomevalonate decarboxylase [Cognatiyoonia sp.]|uniref:diphosphomevalonate decarboxylase n=1 Tax=Cognatiyoonia sp. TaxID=2211652 RepID=UPI003F6A017C
MATAEDIFARVLPADRMVVAPGEAYAPANIALSKYWGKRDQALNLPLNASLSISLGKLGTTTIVEPAEADTLVFNGNDLPSTDPFAMKVWKFVDLFRGNSCSSLSIETTNTIPTAAGLASSASGFAALVVALDAAFQTNLSKADLSMLARFGSGSATRSLWHGFVRWNKGVAVDGTDSFGEPLDIDFPDLRIAIVPVDTGPKAHTSRDGMNHTVATSPLIDAWPARADADCAALETSLRNGDFETAGQIAEANALAMHATMMAARPALTYLKPKSWEVLETLWNARVDGLSVYATMDAGANVKLIYQAASQSDILSAFPSATPINPLDL